MATARLIIVLGVLAVMTGVIGSSRSSLAAKECEGDKAWITKRASPVLTEEPDASPWGDPCGFFRYAWQAFLHLTSDSGNGWHVFETYRAVRDVFPLPASASRVTMAGPKGQPRILLPRAVKLSPREIASVKAQAAHPSIGEHDYVQADGGVLVAQSGQITYYEQLLNDKAVPFFTECQVANPACRTNSRVKQLRMPAGAIEVKAAWLPMSKSDWRVEKFFRIPAPAGVKSTIEGPIVLALVGFHIAYATPKHPEMVWATFEHRANAPAGAEVAAINRVTCEAKSSYVSPLGFWTYYDPSLKTCAGLNERPAPGQLRPTQVWRYAPFGGGGDKTVLAVQELNESMGQLTAGSVWENYFLVGAVWTNGSFPPDANIIKGSTDLANATMETFVQTPTTNCFGCHRTESEDWRFLVSHAPKLSSDTSCPFPPDKVSSKCEDTQPKP